MAGKVRSGAQRGTSNCLGGDAVQVTHVDGAGVGVPLLKLRVEVPVGVQTPATDEGNL